jgi:hypothetical protein
MADRTVVIDVVAQFVDKVTDKANKASKSIKDLDKANAKPKIDAEDSKFLKKVREAKAKADKLGKTKVSAVLNAVDRASSKIGDVSASLKKFANRGYNAWLNVKNSDAMQALGNVSSSLKSLVGRAWNVTVGLVDKVTAPVRSMVGRLNSVLGLAGAGLSTYGLVIKPIQLEVENQDLMTTFEVLLGSAEAAQQRIEELTKFAGQTPFTRDEIFKASRIMQVYTNGALATADSEGGMKMVGDIAAGTNTDYLSVATWIGRLYSAMEGGRPVGEMAAALQEMGALSAEGRIELEKLAESGADIKTKWSGVTQLFERFDDIMLKQSDNLGNLLLGVKSFVTNNFLKKIGKGLSEGLTPFLKKFRTWRNENSDLIKSMSEGVEKFAATVSQKALGAVEKLAKRFDTVVRSDKFKNADTVWEKIGIVWDEVIAQPFDEWWNSKGKKWLADKAQSIGKGLGEGLTYGIAGLFGIDVGGAMSDGTSIGASFASGFVSGFDGSKVAESIWSGFKKFFKQHPILGLMLGGYAVSKAASGISGIIGLGKDIFGLGKGTVKGISGAARGLKSIGETGYLKGLYALDWLKGTKFGPSILSAGSKLASLAKVAAPYASIAAGTAWAVSDGYKGYNSAEDWLGKKRGGTTSGKVSAAIGGAIGGTGSGLSGALKGAGKGALIGAGIGTLIAPGVGTAVGGAIGGAAGAVGGAIGGKRISNAAKSGWDKTKDFFTETVPEKWNSAMEAASTFFTETIPQKWDELISNATTFFTETIPQKWDELIEPAASFFTETIPEKWNEFTEGLYELIFSTIPEKLGEMFGNAEVFFTETIPEKWNEFIDSASTFFTETIPEKWNELVDGATTFFTETIPEKWNELVDGATTFFTETIPERWNELVDSATIFFTETIPEKWNSMVDSATVFFTETIPEKWNSMVDSATIFFTETIPEKWNSMVDTASAFFTETLPGKWDEVTAYWNSAADTISSGWDTVKSYFMEKADAIGSWFDDKKQAIQNKWNEVKDSFSSGRESAKESKKNKAAGGLISGRTLSWLAEEGTPEMVIPLGKHRRKSALELWKQTGRYLGVQEHASGGLVGREPLKTYRPENSTPVVARSGGNTIEVNVGGVTIQINAENGQSILESIQANKEKIADVLAGVFGEVISKQFENTPLKA